MQEKELILIVCHRLKIPSLRITVQHLSANLLMPNSYHHDKILNLHLTTIKDILSNEILRFLSEIEIGITSDGLSLTAVFSLRYFLYFIALNAIRPHFLGTKLCFYTILYIMPPKHAQQD